eukprot:626533-Pelagomonas_calceolata.AAC.4
MPEAIPQPSALPSTLHCEGIGTRLQPKPPTHDFHACPAQRLRLPVSLDTKLRCGPLRTEKYARHPISSGKRKLMLFGFCSGTYDRNAEGMHV